MSKAFWLLAFLIQFAIIGVATGIFLMKNPRFFPLSRYSRFFAGFAITPYLLGLWVMLLSFFNFGKFEFLYTWGLSIIAMLYLIIKGRRFFNNIWKDFGKYVLKKGIYVRIVITICLIILATTMLIKFDAALKYPNAPVDYLQYMTEARDFMKTKKFQDIPEFWSQPESTRLSFMHGFVYQAYLGQGLLFSKSEKLGFPYDHASRLAFIMTIVTMLLSVGILAYNASENEKWVSAIISIMLLISIPCCNNVYTSFSRDAFRITPLFLLVSLLVSLKPHRFAGYRHIFIALSVFFLVAMTCMGHAFGLFLSALTICGWCIAWIYIYRNKLHLKAIYFVLVAALLGFAWGSQSYLRAFLIKGILPSSSNISSNIFKGTVFEKNLADQVLASLGGKYSWYETMTTITQYLDKPLFWASLIMISLFIIMSIFQCFSRDQKRSFTILGTIAFTSSLLWIGVFDFFPVSGFLGITMSQLFARNSRYILGWAPFMVVLLSISLFSIMPYITERCLKICHSLKFLNTSRIIMLVSILLVFISTYRGVKQIKTGWTGYEQGENKQMIIEVDKLNRAINLARPNSAIIGNDDRFAYYLEKPIGYLGTPPTKGIIQAPSVDVVGDELKRMNVGIVYFLKYYFYEHTLLWDYLKDPNNTISVEGPFSELFILKSQIVPNLGSPNSANLLSNGDFESWSAGTNSAPDGWNLSTYGSETVERSTEQVKLGKYSAKITRAKMPTSSIEAKLMNNNSTTFPPEVKYWEGKVITLGCWVWCSTPNSACIGIDDGMLGSGSTLHPGDSTWRWLTATYTCSSPTTRIATNLIINNNDTFAYFYGAICVEGSWIFPSF